MESRGGLVVRYIGVPAGTVAEQRSKCTASEGRFIVMTWRLPEGARADLSLHVRCGDLIGVDCRGLLVPPMC